MTISPICSLSESFPKIIETPTEIMELAQKTQSICGRIYDVTTGIPSRVIPVARSSIGAVLSAMLCSFLAILGRESDFMGSFENLAEAIVRHSLPVIKEQQQIA